MKFYKESLGASVKWDIVCALCGEIVTENIIATKHNIDKVEKSILVNHRCFRS